MSNPTKKPPRFSACLGILNWATQPTNQPTSRLWGVWGSSANDVYAVGTEGGRRMPIIFSLA